MVGDLPKGLRDGIRDARAERRKKDAIAELNLVLEETVHLADVCSMYSQTHGDRPWCAYQKSSDGNSFQFDLPPEPEAVQLERMRKNPAWKECSHAYAASWSRGLIFPLADLIRTFGDHLGLDRFRPEGPGAEVMHELFFDLVQEDVEGDLFIEQLAAVRIELAEARFDLQSYFEQLWHYLRRRYAPSPSPMAPRSVEEALHGGWRTTKLKLAKLLGVDGAAWYKGLRADRNLPAPVVRSLMGGSHLYEVGALLDAFAAARGGTLPLDAVDAEALSQILEGPGELRLPGWSTGGAVYPSDGEEPEKSASGPCPQGD